MVMHMSGTWSSEGWEQVLSCMQLFLKQAGLAQSDASCERSSCAEAAAEIC